MRSKLEVTVADQNPTEKEELKFEVRSLTEASDGSTGLGADGQLHLLRADYGKLVAAHKTLMEKYSQSLATNKKWQVFYKGQKKKRNEKKTLPSLGDISRENIDLTRRHEPTSSALAPPSSRSLSYGSTSTSPSNAGVTHRRSNWPQAESSLSGRHQNNGSSIKDIHHGEDTSDIQNPCSVNSAETCAVSQNVPVLDPSPTNPNQDSVNQEVKPKIESTDDDSNLPIIVSERPVKRRRNLAPRETNMELHKGAKAPAGQIETPIHIKSDPGSSSPAASIAHLGLMNPQDSMDLDEVGERHFTPRKRRRLLDEMRLRSSGLREPLVSGNNEPFLDHRFNHRSPESLNDLVSGPEDRNLIDALPLSDETVFTKNAERYEGRIEEEQKCDLAREAGVAENAQVSKRVQSRSAKAGRQKLSNHKQRPDFTTPLKVASKDSITKPTSLRGSTTYSTTNAVGEIHGGQIRSLVSFTNELCGKKATLRRSGKLNVVEQVAPEILRSTDPNIQFLPRTSKPSPDRRRFLTSSRERERASAIFADDGEEYIPEDDGEGHPALEIGTTDEENQSKDCLYNTSNAADMEQRLATLLAQPSPQNPRLHLSCSNKNSNEPKTVLSTPLGLASRQINIKDSVTPNNLHHQNSAFGSMKEGKLTRPSTRSRAEVRPTSVKLSLLNDPEDMLPKHEPLRIRPPSTLSPADFKLNPAHNHGYDHPYSEVVRNRDQRKCMPGCTRVGCCGTALRKAVEMGGSAAPSTLGLSPEGVLEQEQHLLEEYLGDDAPRRLKGISDTERRQLLLKAQTERFADRFGKHRYVYGRAHTPPGYWETDMPDTQQQERFRAKAKAMEKDKVREMYREAMRPDGRYRFRDE